MLEIILHIKYNSQRTTIGGFIRDAREKQNISPQELATRVGVSSSLIYHIENNTRDLKTKLLIKIGKTLNIDQLDIINMKNGDDSNEGDDE